MSQHDYVIGNDDGAAVRTDINNVLAAVKSGNSDASSAPSGPTQGMFYRKLLSGTCQETWEYDGSSWVLRHIIDPTAHKIYPANIRKIAGLTLSNNVADATNDIDIAAGWTAADTDGCPLILTSALTKRLDVAWAVGTNQGGLDTGAIANTTYHMWLIRRPDTGVVDVLFSASATSPTMPANYTQKRRIGSIIRASAAIVTFRQFGDTFRRAVVVDRNNTAAAASALLALSIPAGIQVAPILTMLYQIGPSVDVTVALGSADVGSADTTVANLLTGAGDTLDSAVFVLPPIFLSNAASQIYFAQTNTSGTPGTAILRTNGWVDQRGQDAVG